MLGAIASHYAAGTASTYSAEVLSDSPLAYWRLEETSGTTMNDSSGNGRAGTYSGSPTLGAAALIPSEPTTTAATFNSTSWGSVADAAWMDAAHGTLEMLFKTTSTGTVQLGGRFASGTNFHMQLDLLTADGVRLIANTGTGSTSVSTTVTGLRDGNPHHIAGTYDGAALRIYIDGTERTSLLVTGSLSASSAGLRIAARADAAVGYPVTIDEFAFYGTALSAARIAAHNSAR